MHTVLKPLAYTRASLYARNFWGVPTSRSEANTFSWQDTVFVTVRRIRVR